MPPARQSTCSFGAPPFAIHSTATVPRARSQKPPAQEWNLAREAPRYPRSCLDSDWNLPPATPARRRSLRRSNVSSEAESKIAWWNNRVYSSSRSLRSYCHKSARRSRSVAMWMRMRCRPRCPRGRRLGLDTRPAQARSLTAHTHTPRSRRWNHRPVSDRWRRRPRMLQVEPTARSPRQATRLRSFAPRPQPTTAAALRASQSVSFAGASPVPVGGKNRPRTVRLYAIRLSRRRLLRNGLPSVRNPAKKNF